MITIEKIKEWTKIDPELVAMIAGSQKAAEAGEKPIIERGISYAVVPFIPGMLELPEVRALNGQYYWPIYEGNHGSNYGLASDGVIRWEDE